MELELNEDQRLIQQTMSHFLLREHDSGQRRHALEEPGGWSRKHWKTLGELGVLSMFCASDDGVPSAGLAELIVVMEALGRALYFGPFLPTAVMSAHLLGAGARTGVGNDLIDGMSEGSIIIVPALLEIDLPGALRRVTTRASMSGGRFRLSGHKGLVMCGDQAEYLLVSARTAETDAAGDGVGIFLVSSRTEGVEIRTHVSADGQGYCDARFDEVEVAPELVIADSGSGAGLVDGAFELAHLALCAEASGVMARMIDDTVAHLANRRQFGRPLSQFQALRHRVADMAVALEEARAMTQFAAMAMQQAMPERRGRDLAAARFKVAQSSRLVSHGALQLHGAIGMTHESDVSHAFRRLATINQWYRVPLQLREDVADFEATGRSAAA